MLLQTNSYVVPKEKRSQHARLVRRFKQCLSRLGCDDYEVYEQGAGTNWSSDPTGGRFVQIMRFRDRRHQMTVQAAERSDPVAQTIIAEFCEIINFPYQQQQGLFAIGYYTSLLASTQKALPHHEPAAVPLPTQAAPAAEAISAAEPSAPPSEIDFAVPMAVDEVLITEAPTEHEPPTESPFADGPPVAELQRFESEVPAAEAEQAGSPPLEHAEAGKNGDAAGEHSVEVPEQPAFQEAGASQAETAAEVSLDELIKQRFGSSEAAPPAEELAAGPQQAAEPTLSSSGIGEVLDASLGDDPDLDLTLPAELLDGPLPENVHQQHGVPSDGSHPNKP